MRLATSWLAELCAKSLSLKKWASAYDTMHLGQNEQKLANFWFMKAWQLEVCLVVSTT